jgi:hypothetical protein
MSALHHEVDRIRAARDGIVKLRSRLELGAAAPDEIPRQREWVAREVLAHIDEMLPYWLGEIERVLAGPVEPVPFGRIQADLVRILAVDRDRTLPAIELYARLDMAVEHVSRRLLSLDDRQCARRGVSKQHEEMTVRDIVTVTLAGHLEEHAAQLAAALDSHPA